MKAGWVCVAAAVLVAGCGKKDETTTTVAPGVTVTTSKTDGSETATVNLGGTTIVSNTGATGMAVPANLPAWAPAYPGGKIVSTMSAGGDTSKIISIETSDEAAKVIAFYDARIAAAGVKPAMSTETADAAMRMIPADSKNGSGMVMVSKRDDGTPGSTVVLTYGGK